MSNGIIKSISENICPHCSKPIMISSQFTSPVIDWILKPEDLKAVKAKTKKAIEGIAFKNEENKKEVLAWLNKKETVFGPDELDAIIAQIKEEHSDQGK